MFATFPAVNFLPLLEAKRDGRTLDPAQLAEIINSYTAGQIPDYQMAAFLMAVYFRGLNPLETRALTLAMRDSGEKLAFPPDTRPLADKHSTGGVGDKVSLPLAPLLACLGLRVPMISGRGLGITGGTLDKLDSIPGFKTTLPAPQIIDIVQTVGCVICGQTDRMVPADKGLYALRDVTGTVPSVPLIVASILAKKLAEGLDALVLDVKFGAAAFMATEQNARELATAMVELGVECGVNTRALLSSMDTPLGRAAGNWLEVVEAVQCLEGHGPPDLEEIVLACAANLLLQTRKAPDSAQAARIARDCLASGEPRRKWDAMLAAQGADLDNLNRKLKASPAAATAELRSDTSGFVSRCDARLVGELVRDLGGGRLTKESKIDYHVGVDDLAKPGERVEKGALLGRVHARDAREGDAAVLKLRQAFDFSAEPVKTSPRIIDVLQRT